MDETTDYFFAECILEHEQYWQTMLQGQLPVLDLPLDKPRPVMQEFLRDRQTVLFDEGLLRTLHRIALQEDVDLFTILLTAYQVVLARHTLQEDIIVGTVATLAQNELESALNITSIRTHLMSNVTLHTLIKQVGTTIKAVARHRGYPFERLVDLYGEKHVVRAPIFQAMLILCEERSVLIERPVTILELDVVGHVLARCDLVVIIVPHEDHLHLECEYDSQLFEAETVRCLLLHIRAVLEQIVISPDSLIGSLSLLTAQERQLTLVEWNATAAVFPLEKGVQQLFEEQVRQTPNTLAIIWNEQWLTYEDLNRRANRIARQLQQLGVRRNTLVALYVERSVAMVVGVLAILKAGGAYLPLEVSHPSSRLEFLLRKTHAPVLLTQIQLAAKVPPGEYVSMVVVDADEEATTSTLDDINVDGKAGGDDLVYIMYTSGSTGDPKGVMISHRVLMNLICWQRTVTLVQEGRMVQFAAIGFDSSIAEMMMTFHQGDTLYIVPDILRFDIEALADYLISHDIEKAVFPGAVLQQLAEIYVTRGNVPSHLREVIATGEQLRITQPIIELFRQLVNSTLYNQYGPTETHVVTHYKLPDDLACWTPLPSIGRPIANVQMYVLNENLQPVGISIPGELYIGGVSLAHGYWDDPVQTALKFIPNPFTTIPGSRLYKTGDMARYTFNGNIEFLGRRDNQVKIRGFRVELAEIEVTLLQHPLIQDAVVLAHTNVSADLTLVAHVVPLAGIQLERDMVRQFLATQLPSYMIPATFRIQSALPLTGNGKVDRKALAAQAIDTVDDEKIVELPRTPIEEQLLRDWTEILKIKGIGIHDNFFSLGGHSLLGSRLISAFRHQFQVELTLYDIFERPTIAGLAETIESLRQSATAQMVQLPQDGLPQEEFEV